MMVAAALLLVSAYVLGASAAEEPGPPIPRPLPGVPGVYLNLDRLTDKQIKAIW